MYYFTYFYFMYFVSLLNVTSPWLSLNKNKHLLKPIVSLQVSNAIISTQDQEESIASYYGSQVWRTKFRGEQDIVIIKKLVEDQDISIWNVDYKGADYLVHSDNKVKVNRALNSRKLNHSVLVLDVQRRINSLKLTPTKWNADTLRIGHRLNWKEYPTLKIIDEYFSYLSENFPSICNVSVIGYTAENRTIKMLRVSNDNPENKVFMVISGMHAREWIAITSALYVLDKIVTKFDHLPQFMRDIEWLIIPVMNPDGYEYSHTHDRLWRKNRRNSVFCKGVDINRNFGTDWDVTGIADKNECYESYSGPHPFSEAETKALRDVMMTFKKKPNTLVDLHSYGQLILYPWGAKDVPTADNELLWKTAKGMAEAIFNTSGNTYKFGTTYRMIYPATGSGIDWLYSSGIVLPLAIELGDKGDHGFLLPPNSIKPIGEELYAAVTAVARKFQPQPTKNLDPKSWF